MLLAASVIFTALDVSRKWNSTVYVLLGLARCTWRNILQVHPCCHIGQDFIFTAENYSIVGMYIFFIHRWTFRLLSHFSSCESCYSEYGSKYLFEILMLVLLDQYPGLGLADRVFVLFLMFRGTFVPFFIAAFLSAVHRIPVFPHLHQQLPFFFS